MARLDIRIYDDPVLRATAAPISEIAERHHRLAEDMAETMYAAQGIGLAANQIGLLERIVIVDVNWNRNGKGPKNYEPRAMINPEVLAEAPEDDVYSEGCLSLPEVEGDVWRPTRIRYRYTDLQGQTHEAEARDLEARCILHEIDHLNGVLFIDRLAEAERRRLAAPLRRLRERRSAKL